MRARAAPLSQLHPTSARSAVHRIRIRHSSADQSHRSHCFNSMSVSGRIQAMFTAGGPRSALVRSKAARAAARMAPGAYASAVSSCPIAVPVAATNTRAVVAAGRAGNCGHRDGALNVVPAPSLRAAWASPSIAQWCAPWRRQQKGRRASFTPGSTAASGPSHRSTISEIEKIRRILPTVLIDHPIPSGNRAIPKRWSGMIEP